MGRCRRLTTAADWRLTACLIFLAALAAAPTAVRGEQMRITTIHRGARVEEVRTVVQAQRSAVEASVAASALRGGSKARTTGAAFIGGPPPQQPSELSQRQRESAASIAASIPVGGCPLTNYNIPVKLSHGGTIPVILDSGSADLAVASTGCDSSCAGIPGAFPFGSPGNTGFTGKLGYGSAQLSGEVFTEQIQLEGLPAVTMNMLAITHQTGLFRKESCIFDAAEQQFDVTGILGFAPDVVGQLNDDATIVTYLADAGAGMTV